MSRARIRWISGPLLKAISEEPFGLYEAVRVGDQRLLGEVIRIDGDQVTVQVYEDTTGLAPGAPVVGDGLPLSVRLGPGLLGGIFDGLLRPLFGEQSPYIQRGMGDARNLPVRFGPATGEGKTLLAGAVLGTVHRANARDQKVLVPPERGGTVRWMAGAGEYTEDDLICRVQDDHGEEHGLTLAQRWPVRLARPLKQRLPSSEPLVTGQRIIDSLFPIALGGRSAIPGGFGTGKTVLLESLAKWCSADIIVYVGCGERGNELTGMLEEFPELDDPRTGRPLMERTVIIANTSNMPVAAREASIYTAVTVAEYFRDQGFHVALMADSTSRWAEALRELSGRLGELPGEGGYPAYLSSRLADFYERAARVQTLAGEEGSVTIMGTVSPPSGDFSEPVTTHTKRYVRSFWALDSKRAQARIYPAINPLQSYAEDAERLAGWWREQGSTEWITVRRRILTLLEQQMRLERMARIIGKSALAYPQQITLLSAELMTDGFMRQSAYSEMDRYTSPRRQAYMLKLLSRFIQYAEDAVARGITPEAIGSLPMLRRLQRMGEELGEGDWEGYDRLAAQLEQVFQDLVSSRESRLAENAGRDS